MFVFYLILNLIILIVIFCGAFGRFIYKIRCFYWMDFMIMRYGIILKCFVICKILFVIVIVGGLE